MDELSPRAGTFCVVHSLPQSFAVVPVGAKVQVGTVCSGRSVDGHLAQREGSL